ncbi:MAG: amidohydrolase family protein [Bacteroidales bacterium]|nr:amidohydrolase family protein [Bacteroidales bacterium]
MLLDINAYVGHWPFKKLRHNTCSLLLERMNRFGVDVSVVSNINGIFYKNTQSANEELFEEIDSDTRFKGRFVPFAVINPIYAGWRDDFEVCVSKMGMKGLRLFPQYHDYEITDPSLVELVGMARDLGLPVAFDIRMVDSRQKSWLDLPHYDFCAPEKSDIIFREWSLKNILPVIKAVPDAKYIIVNLANSISLSGEEIDIIKGTDLVFDTSGRAIRGEHDLALLLKRFGREKFALGAHSPFLDYLTGRLRIESMSNDETDESTKELIRSGNAIRMLGMKES